MSKLEKFIDKEEKMFLRAELNNLHNKIFALLVLLVLIIIVLFLHLWGF
jgi:hypothetical protein